MQVKSDRSREHTQRLLTLCKLLSTAVAYKILISLFNDSKSVAELSAENKLPVSSAYKAVRDLQKLELVVIDRIVVDDKGKRIAIYKANVSSLTIFLNRDGSRIETDN
jgi:predicted transcriptional regulator